MEQVGTFESTERERNHRHVTSWRSKYDCNQWSQPKQWTHPSSNYIEKKRIRREWDRVLEINNQQMLPTGQLWVLMPVDCWRFRIWGNEEHCAWVPFPVQSDCWEHRGVHTKRGLHPPMQELLLRANSESKEHRLVHGHRKVTLQVGDHPKTQIGSLIYISVTDMTLTSSPSCLV